PSELAVDKPAPIEDEKLYGLISAFVGNVGVTPETGTRLVTISYTHSNPKLTADAANAIAEEYTKMNLEHRLETIQNSLKWVDDELVRQQDLLQKSEAALGQYREMNNAQSLDEHQN